MSVIKIVFGQLLLQSALLKQVIDRTALAEIGLGDFDHWFCIIEVSGSKLVLYVQLLFIGTHKVNSRLRLPLALLISTLLRRVKKIFSIDGCEKPMTAQSSEVLSLYSHKASMRQLPQRGLRARHT